MKWIFSSSSMALVVPRNAVSYWDKWKREALLILGGLISEVGVGWGTRRFTWPFFGRYAILGAIVCHNTPVWFVKVEDCFLDTGFLSILSPKLHIKKLAIKWELVHILFTLCDLICGFSIWILILRSLCTRHTRCRRLLAPCKLYP